MIISTSHKIHISKHISRESLWPLVTTHVDRIRSVFFLIVKVVDIASTSRGITIIKIIIVIIFIMIITQKFFFIFEVILILLLLF